VDKEIEEYPFGYFLATLNGNVRNSYRERGIFLLSYPVSGSLPSIILQEYC